MGTSDEHPKNGKHPMNYRIDTSDGNSVEILYNWNPITIHFVNNIYRYFKINLKYKNMPIYVFLTLGHILNQLDEMYTFYIM